MIEFIRNWANQIIVAVIISTIIEIILPNDNNKKYIKTILGLYVLITIIQPLIIKITGKSITISDFYYKKYFNEDILEDVSADFEDNNSKLIKQAYIGNIKEELRNKMSKKGYEVIDCSIEILETDNKDIYGTIQRISLKIQKQAKERIEEIKESNNIINIEEIDINITNKSNIKNDEQYNDLELLDNEKREIIEFISEEYSIDKKNIVIN